MTEAEINIFESSLVPKQTKLSEDEKRKLLESYKIGLKHLPRMSSEDPVAKFLGAKRGDVVRSTRTSPMSDSEYFYYRVVV